jgi:hypothetical protein
MASMFAVSAAAAAQQQQQQQGVARQWGVICRRLHGSEVLAHQISAGWWCCAWMALKAAAHVQKQQQQQLAHVQQMC